MLSILFTCPTINDERGEKSGPISLYFFTHILKFDSQLSYFILFILFFETRSCYVVQAGLELAVLLPQTSECWEFRHVPPYPAHLLISWSYTTHSMKNMTFASSALSKPSK
jgi:hypothetical protein